MSGRYAPYVWSLLLHALLVGLLSVSLHAPTPKPAAQPQDADPIQARAVDESQVEAEVERLRSEARRQQEEEAARRRQLQDEERQAREARQQEEKRVVELKRRAEEEQKQRIAAEKERQAKEAAEQKRLAELKQAQEAAEKKRLAEEKRTAELAAKRKQEEERLRREEEARKKAAQEAELKQKMEEEQRRLAAENERLAQERARQNATLIQRYMADIRNKVERNWLRPPGTRTGMTCTVLVQQLPTGDVVNVRITRSSGDPVFDRSVENAVHKASPLPPPPVPELFEREIEFKFEAR